MAFNISDTVVIKLCLLLKSITTFCGKDIIFRATKGWVVANVLLMLNSHSFGFSACVSMALVYGIIILSQR